MLRSQPLSSPEPTKVCLVCASGDDVTLLPVRIGRPANLAPLKPYNNLSSLATEQEQIGFLHPLCVTDLPSAIKDSIKLIDEVASQSHWKLESSDATLSVLTDLKNSSGLVSCTFCGKNAGQLLTC